MNIRARYMYQRNSNEQSSTQRQRPGNPGNGDDDKGNTPRKKGISLSRVFLLTTALIAVFAVGSFFLNGPGPNMNGQPVGELPYSSFYQQVMGSNVKDATFQ